MIKAVTGITLGKYGEVDDNPAGGMPPWEVILDINYTFDGTYKDVAKTPSSIADILEKHHFTPPASYDPNLLFGVWDGDRPKADGSTIDVQA